MKRPSFSVPARAWALAAALLGGAAALVGCTPEIGDGCRVSTDCSIRGDRLCDTSQPGGYCTLFNCRANSCPDETACVLFQTSVPGCAYDDRRPSRTSRSFCTAPCDEDGDCREGYVCRSPGDSPWRAVVLDDRQRVKVCLPAPLASGVEAPTVDAPVCRPGTADGGLPDAPPREGGAPDAGDAERPRHASGDAANRRSIGRGRRRQRAAGRRR